MKRELYAPGKPGVTLFDDIISMDNLREAHKHARMNKTWYKEVQMVDSDPDYYLQRIHDALYSHTFHTSNYDIFERQEFNKTRVIYKLPYYPDRIVQWAIILKIRHILERTFISTTYSSVPNRGPLRCMIKVHKDMCRDYYGTMWCLKLDIHHYYPSIDHMILKQMYRRLFKDDELLWLIDDIIDSVPNDKGVPIGNFLSQYSGNLYLTWFDHWVKEVLHVKYYYRYMDDMVFLFGDPKIAWSVFSKVTEYLNTMLRLSLKENYQLYHVDTDGVDFVGFRIYHDHVLIRNRIKKNYIRKVRKYRFRKMTPSILSSYSSYMGFLQHANTYNLQKLHSREIDLNWGLKRDIKTIRNQPYFRLFKTNKQK